MNQLLYFIRRNLRLFCGNRLNILLSFASVLIVIGIYMLFLRDFCWIRSRARGWKARSSKSSLTALCLPGC